MTEQDIEKRGSSEAQKFLQIRLGRVLHEGLVDSLLVSAGLPDDVSDRTILINGRDSSTISSHGARSLIRIVSDLKPHDIVATHLADEDRMKFYNAYFDLGLGVNFAYVDYEEIPDMYLE